MSKINKESESNGIVNDKEVRSSDLLDAKLDIALKALRIINSGTEDQYPPFRTMSKERMQGITIAALAEIKASNFKSI